MTLDIGSSAPEFTLRNQYGEAVSLSQFRGDKNVLIVFYPFAFSGVCTGELQEIRDHVADLSGESTEILAISVDHMFSLRAYAERDGYEFSLLSDYWPHGDVARAYGIFDDEVGCAGRATFIVDRDGVVRWSVANAIPDARSLADYQGVIGSLQ